LGIVGLCIAPAGGDEFSGGDPAAKGPPEAENADGCQRIGVEGEGKGVACGVELPGKAVPKLLPVVAHGGRCAAEVGGIEEVEAAEDGVAVDGDVPAPI